VLHDRDATGLKETVHRERARGAVAWKVNLTLAQAFRTALGQLLEYGHLLFAEPPNLIMFLDQKPDERRLQLASDLKIAVVRGDEAEFVLLNPYSCDPYLKKIFGVNGNDR
jgi:hypothetical protein